MKKWVHILSLLLVVQTGLAQVQSLDRWRQMLLSSKSDARVAEEFLNQSTRLSDTVRPILIGYKAMGHLMYCNHASSTSAKLSHFKTGKSLLENALQKDPRNAELIYFRYSTQTNAPAFLGYRSHVSKDKAQLVNYLKSYNKRLNPDPQLFAMIKTYLLYSSDCTEEEKALLKPL